jgi:hypothetical protein
MGNFMTKHSKGMSQFGAALGMLSGLFDKSSQSGQVFAGSVSAIGGAMRVLPVISQAV